ncbi:unnamed protein product [Caenorhabditis nigoni]
MEQGWAWCGEEFGDPGVGDLVTNQSQYANQQGPGNEEAVPQWDPDTFEFSDYVEFSSTRDLSNRSNPPPFRGFSLFDEWGPNYFDATGHELTNPEMHNPDLQNTVDAQHQYYEGFGNSFYTDFNPTSFMETVAQESMGARNGKLSQEGNVHVTQGLGNSSFTDFDPASFLEPVAQEPMGAQIGNSSQEGNDPFTEGFGSSSFIDCDPNSFLESVAEDYMGAQIGSSSQEGISGSNQTITAPELISTEKRVPSQLSNTPKSPEEAKDILDTPITATDISTSWIIEKTTMWLQKTKTTRELFCRNILDCGIKTLRKFNSLKQSWEEIDTVKLKKICIRMYNFILIPDSIKPVYLKMNLYNAIKQKKTVNRTSSTPPKYSNHDCLYSEMTDDEHLQEARRIMDTCVSKNPKIKKFGFRLQTILGDDEMATFCSQILEIPIEVFQKQMTLDTPFKCYNDRQKVVQLVTNFSKLPTCMRNQLLRQTNPVEASCKEASCASLKEVWSGMYAFSEQKRMDRVNEVLSAGSVIYKNTEEMLIKALATTPPE